MLYSGRYGDLLITLTISKSVYKGFNKLLLQSLFPLFGFDKLHQNVLLLYILHVHKTENNYIIFFILVVYFRFFDST